MNEAFSKEIYQKACERLTPSSGSLREVYAVKKPKKYPRLKRKAFAATAASAALICSLSVGVLAASDTDIRQAAGEAVQQIAMVFKNVTVDQEASTPYETVLHAEDGTQITAVHEYGENGEYYVTLVYHEDTKRLGLTIEDKEIDITDQLKEKGVYTQNYTFEEAKDIVLDALSILGDSYITDLSKAFDEKWIDVMPSHGKKGGAYSWGSYTTNPYLLLNFIGKFDDV